MIEHGGVTASVFGYQRRTTAGFSERPLVPCHEKEFQMSLDNVLSGEQAVDTATETAITGRDYTKNSGVVKGNRSVELSINIKADSDEALQQAFDRVVKQLYHLAPVEGTSTYSDDKKFSQVAFTWNK